MKFFGSVGWNRVSLNLCSIEALSSIKKSGEKGLGNSSAIYRLSREPLLKGGRLSTVDLLYSLV
jgi:hypothetical protein